jgi:hypothetical protein
MSFVALRSQRPNMALNRAPFGRWTALKRRRLALLQGLPQIYN